MIIHRSYDHPIVLSYLIILHSIYRLVCRVRPLNNVERGGNGITCVISSENKKYIEIQDKGQSHPFQCDQILGPESTQQDVFECTARPSILGVLQGFNATVFAYGQTASGKTHTMEGNINDEQGKGIIPRAVEALFDAVGEADESVEFTFNVTYVEIYMEMIRDLLDEKRSTVNLEIREDKVKGIFVENVTVVSVKSRQELLQFMAAGAINRATAPTGMNNVSSRSHSVFTLTVTQKDTRNGVIKSGKLVLVDLAGSEMVSKTGASGKQLEESNSINKSLSALKGVISALTDDKRPHIPYRDSKLTRLLQDSLGGNSKTVLIATISPSSDNARESLSTLRFAMSAKCIVNKVTVNRTRSPEELAEIARLQYQLDDAQTAATEMQTTVAQLEADVDRLTQELENERAEGRHRDSENVALTEQVKENEVLLAEARESLQKAHQQYEADRTKSDQLLREKAALEDQFPAQRDQWQGELDKARSDLQGVEAAVETLRNEKAAMAGEIAEMRAARDAAVALAAQQARGAHEEAAQALEAQRVALADMVSTVSHFLATPSTYSILLLNLDHY